MLKHILLEFNPNNYSMHGTSSKDDGRRFLIPIQKRETFRFIVQSNCQIEEKAKLTTIRIQDKERLSDLTVNIFNWANLY
jgi:hypothetical protein